MTNKWFRWEREASIHLLIPTLETFYQPLKKYSGISAPTMILIFQKGMVTWCIKEDEFAEFGKELLNIYIDPKKEKQLVKDINSRLKKLKRLENELLRSIRASSSVNHSSPQQADGVFWFKNKLSRTNLTTLTNEELVKIYQELHNAFVEYYTPGSIGTPLSLVAEELLKKSNLTNSQIAHLTAPEDITYTAEAEKFLLKTKNVDKFIEKYFWLDNNYSGTRTLTKKDVKERLKNLKTIQAQKLDGSQNSIKLSKRSKRLVEMLQHYAIYKDDRKKNIFIYLHFVDMMLAEISRRTKLTIDEVRYSCPSEVVKLLDSSLTKAELKKRKEFCVIVWEKGSSAPLILTGIEGKNWEQKTLTITIESKIVNGSTACPGKVKGKVRILLKASESNKLKEGEVLVTFMTSPDFMPAIRKSSAIVTNLGGVTSHAAIISRELGIPCIVGTKVATKVLKTGDFVEVDALSGIVSILS